MTFPSPLLGDALDAAHALLGAELTLSAELQSPFGITRVRLSELEAYRSPGDTANHARFGRTARNAPMWGPAGHVYIYLCYGVHSMLNLVTGPEGEAAAVLVRGVEPLDGDLGTTTRRIRLDGPGKVGRALGIHVGMSGRSISDLFSIVLPDAAPARRVGPRIGIDYASEADRSAPWRVGLADSAHVGHRRAFYDSDAEDARRRAMTSSTSAPDHASPSPPASTRRARSSQP